MSETETISPAWPDRPLSEAQIRNRDAAALIPVSRSGAVLMDFAQQVQYAQFMSTAKGAVGAHLMGNVGACLAVMEIANQFGLPMYAVARQSYLVNNRIAFMGQFFHTIVEDYAPLKKGPNGRKLQFRFDGDGPTLKITVSATFEGASEPVEFESPMFKDIMTKNSPLWKSSSPSDVKRQFTYYGVRGWQTTCWPEGMMHAISEDEAAALPPSEYARDVTPIAKDPKVGELRERLAAAREADGDGPREGHQEGFTDAAFTEIANGNGAKTDAAIEETVAAAKVDAPAAEPPKETAAAKPKKPTKAEQKAAAEAAAAKPPADLPKTPAEWVTWATAWLDAETDPAAMRKRWQGEQKLRNEIGVTSEERDPVFVHFQERLTALEGE